jgi:hypothetical protein
MLAGQLGPLPIELDELERRRLHFGQRFRSGAVGAHLTRRRGQSLEFRELTPYVIGDDVRHIDWRASARLSHRVGPNYLVRRFQSEELLTVAVSFDRRATLAGPEGAPKWMVAAWLVEAVGFMVLRNGGRIVLHCLSGPADHTPIKLSAPGAAPCVRDSVERLIGDAAQADGSVEACLERLWPELPPAAVWLIVTDGYFDGATRDLLVERIRRAQDGHRWVIVFELDTWAFERASVGTGPRRIVLTDKETNVRPVEIEADELNTVENRIDEHLAPLRAALGEDAYRRWTWPTDARSARDVFAGHFLTDAALQKLFERDP